MDEFPVSRLLRDIKLLEIGARTSEIRRLLIAAELFDNARRMATNHLMRAGIRAVFFLRTFKRQRQMANMLGIDVGSAAVGLAVVNELGEVVHTDYTFHQGDTAGCYRRMLAEVDLEAVAGVAATTSTPETILSDYRYDNQIAVIQAVRRFHG